MNAKQLWQAALEHVRACVSAASFTTWFKSTEGIALAGDELLVAAPNSFASEHLRQRFHELAAEAASLVIGRQLFVSFTVRPRQRGGAQAEPARVADREMPAAAVTASVGVRAAPQTAAPPTSASSPAPAHAHGATRRRQPASAGSGRTARFEQRAALDVPHAPPSRRTGPRARRGASLAAQPPLLPAALDAASTGASETPPSAPHLSRPPAVVAHIRTPADAGQCASPFGADPSGRHVFETFVVGTGNRLAYAAAQQVASQPGQSYNPLFIYGGTGLGKTHLLLAIGHVASQQGLNVCYVPAERFANDLIEAIRHHTTDEFRAHYRQVDVLLVDDIQFIAGKESTEEEFFHTFNELHDDNRQIVLSSDRTPRAMLHLHDRLRSRFEWGLMADIRPPDLEHREEILRAKAATLGLGISDAVLAAIARPECASVRELEGALNRVLAYARMLGRPVDVEMVGQALTPLRDESVHEVTCEQVLALVAQHYGVTVEALRGKARSHAVAWPRQIAMYLLREETPVSLGQIGQHLGGRDHTTVMHGCARVGDEAKARDDVRRELAELRAELRKR